MRGSLSVIAFSAVAGLALLCTALFGNQAELQARGAAPTIHQSPITRLHEVTARQANHSGRASSSISSGPRASRDGVPTSKVLTGHSHSRRPNGSSQIEPNDK